jgi:hypothetical protein
MNINGSGNNGHNGNPLDRNSMRINGGNNSPSNNSNDPNQNGNNNNQNNTGSNRNSSGRRSIRDSFIHPDSFLGKLFNRRGNNSNSNNNSPPTQRNNNQRNNRNGTWLPWLFLGVIVLFGVFYSEKNTFNFDRSFEENFNLFLTNVEGANPHPMGREGTGNKIYDDNLITSDMVEEMGHDRYFVYVYKNDEMFDKEFNDDVLEYIGKEDSVPVYRLDSYNALENEREDLFLNSPKIIEYVRLDQFAVPVVEYTNSDSWRAVWEGSK